MRKVLDKLKEPSTRRALVVAITGIFGYALPDAKMQSIMVVFGFVVFVLNEVFSKQFDTPEQNREQ